MIKFLFTRLVYKARALYILGIIIENMSGEEIYFDDKLYDIPNWTDEILSGLAFNSLIVPSLFMIFLAFQLSKKCQKILRQKSRNYRLANQRGVSTTRIQV